MILTEFDRKGYRKTIREESYADGEKAGREEGRAEERVNTEAEKKRADEAEARIRELEAELAKCAI